MKDDIVKSPTNASTTTAVIEKPAIQNAPKQLAENENYGEKIDPVMTKPGSKGTVKPVEKKLKPQTINEDKNQTVNSEEQKPKKSKNTNSGPVIAISFALIIFIALAGLAVYNQMQ